MNFIKFFCSITLILFISFQCFSQGPPIVCNDCPPGECCDPDNDCNLCSEIPLDGGVSLLLIIGGAYGINKIRRHHKKTKEPFQL